MSKLTEEEKEFFRTIVRRASRQYPKLEYSDEKFDKYNYKFLLCEEDGSHKDIVLYEAVDGNGDFNSNSNCVVISLLKADGNDVFTRTYYPVTAADQVKEAKPVKTSEIVLYSTHGKYSKTAKKLMDLYDNFKEELLKCFEK